MKSATITFHSAENYGAFLQAYALQHYIINGIKIENDILNFVSPEMKEHYSIIKKADSIKNIIKNISIIPFIGKLKKRKAMFRRDIDKYLKLSAEFSDKDGYRAIIDNYDVCIAGSDQIWNLHSQDASELFFLPDAKRKVSYAASLGSKTIDSDLAEYRRLLVGFSHISVRESSAAEYLIKSGAADKSCTVNIDPTFLIDKEEYIRMAGDKPLIKKPYMFFYSINNSSEAMKKAAAIGKKSGIDVYTVYTRLSSTKAYKYGIKVFFEAGPCEFLNLIMNADTVITDSFHGTALSIILKKEFIRLAAEENGKLKKDDRIDSLLEICGLQDRSIGYSSAEIPGKRMNKRYDSRLQGVIEQSRSDLRNSIFS